MKIKIKEKKKNKEKILNLKSIKNMLFLLKSEKRTYIFAIIIRIIGIILALYSSLILGKLVNVVTNKNFENFDKLLIYLIIIKMLETAFTTFGILKIALSTQKIMESLRYKLNKNVQKMPVKSFEDSKSGNLISIFINDLPKVSLALDQSFSNIFLAIIEIFFTILVIIYLNLTIGFISLLFILSIVYAVFKIGRIIKKYSMKKMEVAASVSSYTDEIISNETFIKLYDYEKNAIDKFNEKTDELKKYNITTMIYSNVLNFISTGGVNLLSAIAIFLGSYISFKGHMDIGTLTVIIRLIGNINIPINTLTTQGANLYEGIASTERVFKIFNTKYEEDKGKYILKNEYWYNEEENNKVKANGILEFKNVYYSYKKDDEGFSLKNINFKIDKNKTLAIIGKTGAGKSTVSNLITRFYEINEGEILIDGIDIRDIKKKDLRSIISMVMQDINLFSGSILDNIKYGNLDISKSEVENIIEKLSLKQFIKKFPKGLDTIINTEENSMSEGEKQIISILRAAVSEPKILILDEATSKIDTLTEKALQRGTRNLKKDKINIVIAHRLSTIRNADLIIILDDGEILEIGSPNELISKKGKYFEMINKNKDDMDLKD